MHGTFVDVLYKNNFNPTLSQDLAKTTVFQSIFDVLYFSVAFFHLWYSLFIVYMLGKIYVLSDSISLPSYRKMLYFILQTTMWKFPGGFSEPNEDIGKILSIV